MSWTVIAALGALVGLDSTSFPQAMLSRPIVAGALLGLAFGRPIEGTLVGALVEVFDLSSLPVGAARYPEAGTATVAGAGALFVAGPPGDITALVLAVLFTLLWERIAGASVVAGRRINEHVIAGASSARSIEARHLAAMAIDLVRAAIVSLLGAAIGAVLLAVWPAVTPSLAEASLRALVVGGAAVLGATLALFGGWIERRWTFLAGLATGCFLLVLA